MPDRPSHYVPEPLDHRIDPEALKYAKLLVRIDPHLRSIVYALINRLADDAIRRPMRPKDPT